MGADRFARCRLERCRAKEPVIIGDMPENRRGMAKGGYFEESGRSGVIGWGKHPLTRSMMET